MKKQLHNQILEILKKRKAQDIVEINVQDKTTIADYFIIASAKSSTQTKSLAEFIDEELGKTGINPLRKEGFNDARWIILDYGDVIVHIFNDETRLFYHLETLWGEGKKIENKD